MEPIDKEILWRQFNAAIDMLASALRDCPDDLWDKSLWAVQWGPADFAAFWYLVYHTLFWLDLYLTGEAEGFAPPEPFDLGELDPAGVLPPRIYNREELLQYLEYCRWKCQETILSMSNERAYQLCRFPWGEMPFAELHLDNLRHVQEHGAQLRMFLGQQAGKSARWVSGAKKLSPSG